MTGETEKLTIRINTRLILTILKAALALALVVFAFNVVVGLRNSHISHVTESLMDQGFPALAFEELDPHRESFVTDGTGCRLLLSVYMDAKKMERLEWAYEACKRNKVSVFEVYMARVRLLINSGETEQAIAILRDIKDFRRALSTRTLIDLLMHRDRAAEAISELEGGLAAFPDDEMLRVQGLRIYARLNRWNDAARLAGYFKQAALAGRIRGELLNVLLTAFEKSGDKATVRQIQEALASAKAPPPAKSPN